MKRFAVNYTRSFPDHRVPGDFKIYQQIKASPFDKFRIMKAGFANNCIKYAHIYMSLFAIVTYGVVTYYISSNQNSADTVAKRATNKTGVKWGILSQRPGIGRFDVIHNRFENQQGGIKDWPIGE